MTFSEFAEVLYRYCNEEETEGQFVIKIVDKFMGGRPGRAHADGTYQNPLRDKSDRTLQSYFDKNDTKHSISKADASRILSSMDKYKFEEYIRGYCSEDAQKGLLDDLSKIDQIKNKKDVAEVCADLFEEILSDLASQNSKRKGIEPPQF